METAQPLDRQDLTAVYPLDDLGRSHGHLRAAGRAAIGLSMKAPVRWIVVFGLAGGTLDKIGHGGIGPVVGKLAGNRVARAAVGAGDEGIPRPPVARIEDFGETVGTDGRIRANGRHHRAAAAQVDNEGVLANLVGNLLDSHLVDPRQGWRIALQSPNKGVQILPLDLDKHPRPIVAHPTGEAQFAGKIVDKRAEPDPLHNSANPYFPSQRHTQF